MELLQWNFYRGSKTRERFMQYWITTFHGIKFPKRIMLLVFVSCYFTVCENIDCWNFSYFGYSPILVGLFFFSKFEMTVLQFFVCGNTKHFGSSQIFRYVLSSGPVFCEYSHFFHKYFYVYMLTCYLKYVIATLVILYMF